MNRRGLLSKLAAIIAAPFVTADRKTGDFAVQNPKNMKCCDLQAAAMGFDVKIQPIGEHPQPKPKQDYLRFFWIDEKTGIVTFSRPIPIQRVKLGKLTFLGSSNG